MSRTRYIEDKIKMALQASPRKPIKYSHPRHIVKGLNDILYDDRTYQSFTNLKRSDAKVYREMILHYFKKSNIDIKTDIHLLIWCSELFEIFNKHFNDILHKAIFNSLLEKMK